MAGKLRAIPEYIVQEVEWLDMDAGDIDSGTFKFFVKGPGCPVPVVLETDQLIEDYYNADIFEGHKILTEEEWTALGNEEKIKYNNESQKRLNKHRRAELEFRRDLLRAISRPELPLDAANVLASEDSPGYELLVKCKWYNDSVPDNDEQDSGNVEGVDDGESTSQTLAPSTQE